MWQVTCGVSSPNGDPLAGKIGGVIKSNYTSILGLHCPLSNCSLYSYTTTRVWIGIRMVKLKLTDSTTIGGDDQIALWDKLEIRENNEWFTARGKCIQMGETFANEWMNGTERTKLARVILFQLDPIVTFGTFLVQCL